MKNQFFGHGLLSIALTSTLATFCGCHSGTTGSYHPPEPPQMLGASLDESNRQQEENAEASKYVVYQHEFKLNRRDDSDPLNGLRLNEYGEDHVRRIAENIRRGASYPVLVERSQTSARPKTQYQYPVHFQPALDNKRREVVVGALIALGISDAEQRVIVAPALAHGYQSPEAEAAYRRGQARGGSGSGGFGGSRSGGFGGSGF